MRRELNCIGSQLSWRPDRSNDDVVFLVPRVIFNNGLERASLRSGKSPYFTLSFSFQIIISVKKCLAVAKLVRKPRWKVRQRSIEWFERDVPAVDEVELRRNFSIQVIKKKQAAKGRFCITNRTHESSENVLLKTPSKECVCKILRRRGVGKQSVLWVMCKWWIPTPPNIPWFQASR